ncbi:Protein HUA2-LIKE 1 [Cardamine amara subsp. amara]|uniref:Protein HUA2-LIKE 1 n=1 Tax=Cardamine amara subsp. amara TaxID=228776 RepID=A0ABD1AD39_CARAN
MAPGRKRGANKGMAIGELRLGDLVLAKVKGFPAWPAKISRPEDWDQAPDPKKHFVQFFGTHEIAFITPPDIQVFTSEAKTKLLKRCQGKTVKYFAQAVEEISTAFKELQNHKSGILGDEALLNAVEPSLTKLKILDQTEHRESSNDGNSDKFDSRVDPCLGKLGENNGAEKKPDIGDKDSSPFLKSNNRNTSSSSEPLKHGSPDPHLKVPDFDNKIDGVTFTEHRDGARKISVNGQRIIKKIASDSNKRCKDEVHRAKSVTDSRAATDNHLLGRNQKSKGSKKGQDPGSKKESFDNNVVSDLNIASSRKPKELLKEKPSTQVCADKHKQALGCKSGILGKKKSFESELGNSASGGDERKRAAKRPRSEDAVDQQQCKSKHLLPVGEGKAEGSDSTDVVSILKRETVLGLSADSTDVVSILKRETVLGVSARGGKNQFDKEVVPYTKRHKQTVEHPSVSSFSGSRDKEVTNHPEWKISSSSDSDVKVPAAQLPKRRRAICIYDEDDDDEDPKTPVHGGHANGPKANSASTDCPKSANASHDTSIKAKRLAGSAKSVETGKVPLYKHNKGSSLALPDSKPMGKPVKELLRKNVKPVLRSPKNSPQLVSFKKQVTGQNKTAKAYGAGMPDSMEGPLNSSSIGKPVIKLPPENVKQIMRSSKKSPQLFSTKEQMAKHNKIAKVSGAGMPKTCQGDSSKDAVAGSDRVTSSQSQTANQRSEPAFGEKPTGNLKVATCLNDAGVSTVKISADMIDVNQENESAPLISSGIPDSSSSMKDLIAAAQAKRKQAHSYTSPCVNLEHNLFTIGEMQTKSHSPSVAQNVSSSAGDAMLIVAQGHQEDLTPSNRGHQSSLISNHTEPNQAETEGNEERRVSSERRLAGGSLSGGTEAAISRDTFEGMIETLSRTKESIRRATRMAIDCAKYGIASEVVELLIRKLEIEPHFPRKVDLFFLLDSITQCSHSQKGKAGALYVPIVQAALPRLLGAAAPPGTGARENRHQCRKVLRLWLDRKIFPDSLLRRYIGDIGTSGGDATVGFSLRRPSRSERAVDDPLRDMEGMLVDEYGSNASFQLSEFLSSRTFGDDEEDEDLPSHEIKNTYMEEPVHAFGKLEVHDSSSDKLQYVLEDVKGVLEMEDASCQPRDEVPSHFCGIKAMEDSQGATTATELTPFPEGSPLLPHESPPSPPPLPHSPPPPSPPPPPLSPLQLPPPPPSSEQCSPPPPSESIARPPSSITQPPIPSHSSLPFQPGFGPPAYPLLQHEHQISMQRDHSSVATSNQIVPVLVNTVHGKHADGGEKSEYLVQQSSCFASVGIRSSREPSSFISSMQLEYGNGGMFFKHEGSTQNQQLRPSNTSFLQRTMISNLAPAPSSHFSLPSQIVQSPLRSSFPHPYPFPSQPVDGRRHINEEAWQMPSNGRSADTQNGAWISGRNPFPGSITVADGFFQPPPERPPSGTMSYQLAANNFQAGPTISDHTALQMLPSRLDIPSAARWRPS